MVSQTKPKPGARLDLAHPLSQGLVDWWMVNEGAGSELNSVVQGGRTGTLTLMNLANVWTGSPRGGGLQFDGTNDYVAVANYVSPRGQLTAMAWMYVISWGTTATDQDIIFRHGALSAGNDTSWAFQFDGDIEDAGAHRNLVLDASVSRIIYNGVGSVIELRQWNHLAVTAIENGAVVIYVNGQQRATGTLAAGAGGDWNTTDVLNIGGRASGTDVSDAIFDEFKIYNRVLPPNEIHQSFAEPYVNILRPKISNSFVAAGNATRAMATYRRRRVA